MQESHQFWGSVVKANKLLKWKRDTLGGSYMSLQLTRVALGQNPLPGRHTVLFRGIPIGTLEKGTCEQLAIDYCVEELEISHTGPSDVFVSGFTNEVLDGQYDALKV